LARQSSSGWRRAIFGPHLAGFAGYRRELSRYMTQRICEDSLPRKVGDGDENHAHFGRYSE
jgi:hypothetical protein